MSMFKWDVVDPAPGEAVAPHQRLAWGKTVGLGAQHVVAMFGATFVFPLVMGLDANLAIMFSGLCTILFLLICSNKVPSYLGTSALVRRPASPRSAAQGGRLVRTSPARSWSPASCSPLVGLLVHFGGALADPQDPAAGRHRRRRDADRLQPRARRRRHLLAAGPVGRAADRHVHGVRGRAAARLLVADRGVPRADLRLPALVALRRRLRPDHLGACRRRRPEATAHDRVSVGRRRGRRLDRASRAARSPTASPSSTARVLAHVRSCSCCPV